MLIAAHLLRTGRAEGAGRCEEGGEAAGRLSERGGGPLEPGAGGGPAPSLATAGRTQLVERQRRQNASAGGAAVGGEQAAGEAEERPRGWIQEATEADRRAEAAEGENFFSIFCSLAMCLEIVFLKRRVVGSRPVLFVVSISMQC